MTEEISLARALVELKTLDSRIAKSISVFTPVDIEINKKLKSGKTKVEFEKDAKEELQSITDLIDRRNKIKIKITDANAKTLVKIAGKEMTISAAIDRKNSIVLDKQLLSKMNDTLLSSKRLVESTNQIANSNLDAHISKMVGAKESTKMKQEELEALAKPFMERNEATLFNPLSLEKDIKTLTDEIEEFYKEVDICLSEANARTMIIV
jgi:hypothetical protein